MRPAFVLVWSREAPHRVGESITLPPNREDALLLGRGGERPDDPAPRGTWARQRPGRNIRTASFDDRRLSRRHLLFRRGPDASVAVELIGRGELEVDGRPAGPRPTVEPGSVLSIPGVLSLLCAERPGLLPDAPHWPPGPPPPFGAPDAQGLVGEGPVAWALRERLAFLAHRDRHVLVQGESGTGKELIARALHSLSARATGALVSRNVATVPSGLFDAELFGNARNYPNPGTPARVGLVGEADGGTLFLDEIGELPPDLQAHLLRVLDEGGEYQRLGEDQRRSSDLRLVAATNRDPAELKHDFLARLPLRISAPPLDDRPEDVPLLVRSLFERIGATDPAIAQQFGHDAPDGRLCPRLDQPLAVALVRHRWTTHIRELETLLWLAIGSSPEDVLELTSSVEEALGEEARDRVPGSPPVDPRTLDAATIQAALERCGGVQERAWRELGLRSRYALARLVKKHGITVGEPAQSGD